MKIKIRMKLKKIYLAYLKLFNRLKYAEAVGVNFPRGGLHLYGNVEWSTEPWIITLGTNVHITDGVKFLTHDGGTLIFRHRVPDLEITKPIVIGNNVYIGNNAMLLPGIHVGDNVLIGAGAVVTKNIPNNSVAVGVPARVIKSADSYLKKAEEQSLHLGDLKGEEKDRALRKYYQYSGNSKGIY